MIAEFAAVKALFEAIPLLVGKVHDSAFDKDGEVARGNYVVLYGAGPDVLDDGREVSVAIARPDSDADYEFGGKAVGTDPGAVLLILDAAKSLVGVKPVVVGRRCDPITVEFETVKIDNSVSPPLFFSDFFVAFTSRRA